VKKLLSKEIIALFVNGGRTVFYQTPHVQDKESLHSELCMVVVALFIKRGESLFRQDKESLHSEYRYSMLEALLILVF
jgi:hypothetical protein